MPNIDQWRPYIAQQLSVVLKTQISLGQVFAEWKGLNPSLELHDVGFTDNGQRRVLEVPRIHAVLSWRSLFSGTPTFISLEATGLDLSIRRDEHQQLWILGRAFDLTQTTQQEEFSVDHPALQWLLEQRQIVLSGSTIRWADESRKAPALVLEQVALKIFNKSSMHRLSLSATPAPALGKVFEVRGEFEHSSAPADLVAGLQGWDGQFYVHVDKMGPSAWRPWLDIPTKLDSGEVSAQAWLTVRQGRFAHFTSDVSIRNAHWATSADSSMQADGARLYLSGSWAAFKEIFPQAPATVGEPGLDPVVQAEGGAIPKPGGIDIRFKSQALELRSSELFSHPIAFAQVGLFGTLERQEDSALKVTFSQAGLVSDDMDAVLQGSWRQGGSGQAGIADITGVFKRASIASIDEHLPNTVNLEAREWLAKGLIDGQIHDARLVLNGDLEHFPFETDPAQGDFRIDGRYSGAVIDYLPPEGASLGWPRLNDMIGRVSLHRADLRLLAEQATMWPDSKKPIKLTQVRARIPNIEHNSVLTIQGETVGKGEAYLALMSNSPLGGMLDGVFDEASADGVWDVPLHLTIPLLNSRDTTVKGAIRFAGGSVSLMPEVPRFSQVNGTLNFSDVGLNASNLKAQFLGGPVTFSGGVGGTEKGLQIRGQTTSQVLAQLVGLQGMKRLDGRLSYRATLKRLKSKSYGLSVDSDLTGLALDLPNSLGKKAAQAMPLRVDWLADANGANMVLDIALGAQAKARFLHRKKDVNGPYFQTGAVGVGVGQSPAILPMGLNIDLQHPVVDADLWNDVIDEFSRPLSSQTPERKRPLFADVQQFRLQSGQVRYDGAILDDVVFTAKQPEPLRWRLDISSSQTAGTVFWREASGKIAGRVDAAFERLALGAAQGDVTGTEPGSATSETSNDAGDDIARLDDYFDIPAINLQVGKFKLYGRDVGRLSVEGVSQTRGELWKLNKLSVTSPAVQVNGTGLWRLRGPDRGLTLDAQAKINDMGEYFDQINFKNVLSGGEGTIKGQFEWRNLPWKYKKSDLNGKLEVELDDGRFITLNSRTARLLELLSLQSLRRLAAFKFNPANLAKEGFPFDKLRGTLAIKNGVMTTSNYRVTGPVATIVIGGQANLTTEILDLQAVVIPNLDVSGAAIAAGIAVNPVVGIGAFLTQWLLRAPLAKAMTVQYRVEGNWDAPKISEIAQVKEAEKASLN